MIEIRNLSKRYGSVVAVDRLNVDVLPGRVTGFLGPNGAGKSTTMRMIMGLDRPSTGSVRIDGSPYRRLRDPLRRVGALLEAGSAHAGRTAYHHLLWLAQSNGIGRRRVREVIDLVGLNSVADQAVGKFSLGMSQRLGIAGALLGDPQTLVFDEPINGLDPAGIRWMRTLMKGLAAEGRSVFVSSHLMSEMALTADHLVVIGRGRLLADTAMADFVQRNSSSYTRIRTPEPERMRQVLYAAGIQVSLGRDGTLEARGPQQRTIGELAASSGLTIDELSPQTASLEEAFMQLTAEAVEYNAGELSKGEGR
jgi:ABC-2 type transport system ATP-binding protein